MRSGLYDSTGRELVEGDVYYTYDNPSTLYEVKVINGAFAGGRQGATDLNFFTPLGWATHPTHIFEMIPSENKLNWMTIVSPSKRNLKVYLSGSMTSKDDYEKDFDKWEQRLKRQHFEVVNPAKELIRERYEEYLHHDIGLLLDCDFILFVNDVMTSKGAFIEKMVADACGIAELVVLGEEG